MPDVQPFLGRLRPWVFVMTAALGSFSAHAALFGDDEARRAILELRNQRTQPLWRFGGETAFMASSATALLAAVIVWRWLVRPAVPISRTI